MMRTVLFSFLTIVTLTISLPTLADTNASNTCLSNGNIITLGDNEDQVEKACGTPSDTQNKTKPITEDQEVTHWYYLTQFTTDNDNASNSASNKENTFPIIRIVLQFNLQDKLTNVHVYTPTGEVISEADINLLGYAISLGDSKTQVQDILGKPFETKQLIKPEVVGKEHTDTWSYYKDTNNNTETNTDEESSNNTQTQQLVFVNNKLTNINNS